MSIVWSCVVRELDTRKELARYAYDNPEEATEAVRNVRDIRIKQNQERVTVTLEAKEEFP